MGRHTFTFSDAPLRARNTRHGFLRDSPGFRGLWLLGRVSGCFRRFRLQPLTDTNAVDRARNLHAVAIFTGEARESKFLVRQDDAGYV
jgi:hypothetical protein